MSHNPQHKYFFYCNFYDVNCDQPATTKQRNKTKKIDKLLILKTFPENIQIFIERYYNHSVCNPALIVLSGWAQVFFCFKRFGVLDAFNAPDKWKKNQIKSNIICLLSWKTILDCCQAKCLYLMISEWDSTINKLSLYSRLLHFIMFKMCLKEIDFTGHYDWWGGMSASINFAFEKPTNQ